MLELMFGAKERYRTTRANHPRVAGRENRRRGARTVHCEAYRRSFGHEPYDRMLPRREPEDFERVWRVGHERPDRWPQEVELPDGSGTEYRVIDSRSFWSYSPRDGAHAAATASGTFGPEFEIAYVFDPDSGAPDLSYLEMRAVVSGTQGERRSGWKPTMPGEWEYAPEPMWWWGADDYELVVDAERGTILRLTARRPSILRHGGSRRGFRRDLPGGHVHPEPTRSPV